MPTDRPIREVKKDILAIGFFYKRATHDPSSDQLICWPLICGDAGETPLLFGENVFHQPGNQNERQVLANAFPNKGRSYALFTSDRGVTPILIQDYRLEGIFLSRADLSEAEWRLLKDLLPPEWGCKRRQAHDNRPIVDGILWRVRTGAPQRRDPPTS